jgi:hypothetical protein
MGARGHHPATSLKRSGASAGDERPVSLVTASGKCCEHARGNQPLASFCIFVMNPIFRITYERPWGQCVVHTAQFESEQKLRERFRESYKGCPLTSVQDVTDRFFKKNEKIS